MKGDQFQQEAYYQTRGSTFFNLAYDPSHFNSVKIPGHRNIINRRISFRTNREGLGTPMGYTVPLSIGIGKRWEQLVADSQRGGSQCHPWTGILLGLTRCSSLPVQSLPC
uniref:Uncharacterized protein n=1 Tax=Rhodosorus marinus TaxID=101924 RepID=A0A7S2ZPP3_9RHOD